MTRITASATPGRSRSMLTNSWSAEPDGPNGSLGDEGRNPGIFRDERHLADDLVRTTSRKLPLGALGALNHSNRALDHDVEVLANLALGSDGLPVRVAAFLDQFCDPLDVLRRQVGE